MHCNKPVWQFCVSQLFLTFLFDLVVIATRCRGGDDVDCHGNMGVDVKEIMLDGDRKKVGVRKSFDAKFQFLLKKKQNKTKKTML